jgi:hypothetical protein
MTVGKIVVKKGVLQMKMEMKIDIIRPLYDPETSSEITFYKEYERIVVPRIGERVADYAFEGHASIDGSALVNEVYYKYDENLCEVLLQKFEVPKSESHGLDYWIGNYEKYGWRRYS